MTLMDPGSRIYVAGRSTMAGKAIEARLRALRFTGVIQDEDPDATDREAAERFFQRVRPEFVFVAAGKSAGIGGNLRAPADLMLDNLLVAASLIPAAWSSGVRKLLYLASSCIYPKEAPQPFHPSSLWTGPVEPSSHAYATAKLAGIRLCDAYRQQHGADFITAISADAYGPSADFSPEDSHVAAALLRRIHDARQAASPSVEIWGSGTPRREFVYVDDLADACVFAMQHYDAAEPINLGTGVTTSITELAETICEVVGYEGELRFDRSKPDGMPLKGLDSSLLRALGWTPKYDLRTGLIATYERNFKLKARN